MQDFHRPKQTNYVGEQQARAVQVTPIKTRKITVKLSFNWFIKIKKALKSRETQVRVFAGIMALAMIMVVAFESSAPMSISQRYDISKYNGILIRKPNPQYAQSVATNPKTGAFEYNKDYNPIAEGVGGTVAGPKFAATFEKTGKKKVSITDSLNGVTIQFTPEFKTGEARQDQNRIVYPVSGLDAKKVYTLRAGSIKEDIILDRFQKEELAFTYLVEVPEGTELRAEADGSAAVYGAGKALMSNITTGTEADANLLQKARQNAEKNQLLFRIPAPFILEPGKKPSKANSWFTVKDNKLTVHANNLKAANYPLTIDPSVYIETASKLMRGNNETNTDFDVDNELIQKSQTTGARINAWSSTNDLSSAVWGQGTAVAGGYIYSAGGAGGSSVVTTTYYTAGSTTFAVPTGITSITVKTWGAGGGGGGGDGGSGVGGAGGGAGYAKAVLTTTPGESLTVEVGSAGAKATANNDGGGGGGFTAVKRSATYLVQAGGGGAGGGAGGNNTAGAGGAGGGTSGLAGAASTGGGGGGGTAAAGGAAGTAGSGGGTGRAGIANAGANPGGTLTNCTTAPTGTGGNGGTGAGGDGAVVASCRSGGGGGGGRFGGGSGGSASSGGGGNRSAGGGGGGSSLTTGTGTVETAGSGTTPGNSGDAERNGAGAAGTGATTAAGATAGAAGGVVISYTTAGATAVSTVSWAKFNTATNAIESPNPGTGACAGWCTNSVYDLPVALKDLSLVAYNGFLYALGGATGAGTPQTTVYIAKIGANGEPQLWHPTGGTPGYWYTDTALSAARSKFAAVAYNNRMYILGGLTTSSTLVSSNTVQYANINPMGTFTTWTSTGMSALSSNRYGLSAQVYNDTLYAIGGDATFTGTPVTTVEYAKLNSDGTMNSWVATSSLTGSGRLTVGGSYSTIYGGYIYVGGGCTVVNGSGYCTTMASDVQLASINADGSLAEWNAIIGLDNQRIGHTLIAWQGGLYRLGGCRTQDAGTGSCTDTVLDVDYGVINPDGEASTVATSVASGGAPCSGSTPYSCDLPSASVGNMLNASIIVNGYMYIMGGCTNNACTTYSSGITYQAVGSDGTLRKPASCVGTYTDSYCVSSVSLPSARAATGVTVFNNRIYLIGGFPTITDISNINVNSDGSLGTWTNTDTTTIGATDVSYTFAYARANPINAGSSPGNLYIFGGCSGTISGIGCSGYSDSVVKCDIGTTGTPSACTETGQTQIGTPTGASGTGLGAHAGAVYANYIYLMGGLAPGITDLTTVRIAKFDDSNNVVEADGVGTAAWTEDPSEILIGRRRGAGFGYNGHLYVTGGYDGSDALADIEYARIDVTDGSLDTWVASSVSINKRWGLTVPVSNSYAYVIGGCIDGAAPSSCNTRTNTIQTFQIYNNDSGALQSVTSLSDDTFAADTDRWGASAAILNGYIYVAGGCISATDCTNATNNVQYAAISTTDGSIGTWATTTNILPADRAWGQLEVAGGYLYYLGGQDDASDEKADIYYVGTFTTGNISAAWSTASGGIGDLAGAPVAQDRTKFGATVWNDRIYVVSGLDDSATDTNTVYISPQLSSGGDIAVNSWTSDADVPEVARFGAAVTAYANNLYLFGGNDGANYLNDAQFSQISSDGTIGAWTFTTSMPGYVSQADAFAANGYMYLVGGRSGATACAPKTLIAPISANTTIASGNTPTGIGEWSETNVRYAGGRYGVAVAYDKGKIYNLGGGCTSPQNSTYTTGTIAQTTVTVTGTGTNWTDNYIGGIITYADASTATIVSVNSTTSLTVSVSKTVTAGGTYTITVPRHSYSVVKSQPQVAIYSRMIDTDTDVFPTKWLMNGLDNSIGARWQVRYRSMHDLDALVNPNEDCGTSSTMAQMTTWGQETNFGSVTLGTPSTYTAKESGGGNINCARYYYFYVSIDASKTFGYPEDVNRGPTISDLSLFFTADPSKRLIHGKTFIGGEQQPLDTPF